MCICVLNLFGYGESLCQVYDYVFNAKNCGFE